MRKSKQILLTILITSALICLAWSAGAGRTKEKTVSCVVALQEIEAGSQLQAEQLAVVNLPEKVVADCYIQCVEQAAGQWTGVKLQPGELVSGSRLFQAASGISYPDAGPGRRLMTIRLDPADANGYWLDAGNLVDLYLVPCNRENGIELKMMRNIRVMAVIGGNKAGSGSGSSSSGSLICLDLDSSQVQMIIDSYGICNLHIAVVNETRDQTGKQG